MARHGENIRKRQDGRWEGRYIKGRDAGGKALWGYLYGKSYAQVRQALARKKAETGRHAPPGCAPTFGALADGWLASVACGVKPSTAAHYRYTLERYILPELGGFPVDTLDEQTLEQGILRMVDPKSGRHKPLGASLARECLTLTRRICKYAARLRWMRPVEIVVRLPPSIPKPADPLGKKEIAALEAFVFQAPTARRFGLLLCLEMGLRIGEVCGLQWQDFDLSAGVLTVRRTVQRILCAGGGTRVVVQTPKTRSSRREIPIPRHLLPCLRRLRGGQGGGVWFLSGRAERPVEPRCYRKSIAGYLKKSGVRRVHPHLLRHTFATVCLQGGCDLKTLSELLGHADPGVTLRRYVHSDLARKRREINRIFAHPAPTPPPGVMRGNQPGRQIRRTAPETT